MWVRRGEAQGENNPADVRSARAVRVSHAQEPGAWQLEAISGSAPGRVPVSAFLSHT